MTIDYYFWANKSLKSYSRTWYFRGFVKIREILENIMSAKMSCPTVQYLGQEIKWPVVLNTRSTVILVYIWYKTAHDYEYPCYTHKPIRLPQYTRMDIAIFPFIQNPAYVRDFCHTIAHLKRTIWQRYFVSRGYILYEWKSIRTYTFL